jgi:putative membrane protein
LHRTACGGRGAENKKDKVQRMNNSTKGSYDSRLLFTWALLFMAVFVWSGIAPHDYPTWVLEVFPAIAGAAILWFTRTGFPLTRLCCVLILVHCIILMVGGHYTYAEVPLFDWIRDATGGERNNYDKLGHFVQGFVPAIIAREIVIRKDVFNSARWRDFFIVMFCLGFSAFYELIEWWVALLSEEAADSFLGTQGYIWDTQSDMALALLGAVLALLLLGKLHDRQMKSDGFVS